MNLCSGPNAVASPTHTSRKGIPALRVT
jgi:hypothetical protein